MLDKIALPLCLGLIFWALWRDIKKSSGLSKWTWIPFLWVGLSASKSITRWVFPSLSIAWRERSPGWDPLQGDAFERTFLIILMVIAIAVLSGRLKRFRIDLRANGWLLVLLLYCLLSMFWAEFPAVGIKRWIRLVGDLVMALLILTEDNADEAFQHILRWCAIVLIPLSLVFIKYYRHLGVVYFRYGEIMYVGATGHKNQLGALCAFLGLFLIWRLLTTYPKVDYVEAILLLSALYLLRLSKSQTAVIIFVIGMAVLAVTRWIKNDVRKLRSIILVPLVLLLIFQGFLVIFTGDSAESQILTALGRDATLTGRVPLWRALITIGSRNALLGSGYASFWISRQAIEVWRTFLWIPTTAHNGYIDIFLDLGLVGLILSVMYLISTYKKRISQLRNKTVLGSLMYAYFIMIVLQSITESPILRANSFTWILMILLSMTISVRNLETPGGEPDA